MKQKKTKIENLITDDLDLSLSDRESGNNTDNETNSEFDNG